MKKITSLIFILFLLVGCTKDEFHYYMDKYIEEQEITNIEEVMVFEDASNIKGMIFKGNVDGIENLYYYEGLPGSKKEGIYANGEYTACLLDLEEAMFYDILNGEDYGCSKSYFVGIAYRKMTDVFYKGKSIDFKTVTVTLNGKETTLTVWLMPFNNGEEIRISNFKYKD